MRARDLQRLFRAVYRVRSPDDQPELAELIRAYRLRMPTHAFFSDATAAALHGMPLPARLSRAYPIHVAVLAPSTARKGLGVVSHVYRESRVLEVDGIRVAAPVDTWCQLASVLHLDELVAAGDFLLTGTGYLIGTPPPATTSDLRAAVNRRARQRGIQRLREALGLVRAGAMSAAETRLRLVIVRGDLPEPTLNCEARLPSGRTFHIDLAYPHSRVGIEYEGDGHRTDRRTFQRDIVRREELLDAGWEIIRVTSHDLHHPAALLERIRHRLARRTGSREPPGPREPPGFE